MKTKKGRTKKETQKKIKNTQKTNQQPGQDFTTFSTGSSHQKPMKVPSPTATPSMALAGSGVGGVFKARGVADYTFVSNKNYLDIDKLISTHLQKYHEVWQKQCGTLTLQKWGEAGNPT